MKKGVWHQCGAVSQKLVSEQIQSGCGVGAIISPRDITFERAQQYSSNYHSNGADVLIDFQFYFPQFTNSRMNTYPFRPYRKSISSLLRLKPSEIIDFKNSLRDTCVNLDVNGVIAPAVVYENTDDQIIELNRLLFDLSKDIGTELEIPVYATIVLGQAVTYVDEVLSNVISRATTFDCDGWYYSFEHRPMRILSDSDALRRFANTSIKLAKTGKPVFHAFIGPMGILSLGVGANSVGIGHSQNLWRFCRERWATQSSTQGGGGDAPARFFSKALWGTIIYRDETALLNQALLSQVYTPTLFSPQLPNMPWNRWDSNKHLVNSICQSISPIVNQTSITTRANSAISILSNAVNLHAQIAATGLSLKDDTAAYQKNWLDILNLSLSDRASDYNYIEMLQ